MPAATTANQVRPTTRWADLVAVMLSSDPISSFYWLVAVILIYLTSAADSASDLLIELGRDRRRRTG
jgi:hypothetical protein